MKSRNFEYLRAHQPDLALFGAFAEQYVETDPASAAVKMRKFAEVIVSEIYVRRKLPRPYESSFNDLLRQDVFISAVPRAICDTLHLIRREGNRGAHEKGSSTHTAHILLRETFELGAWFFVQDLGQPRGNVPPFEDVAKATTEDSKGKLKREKKALLESLSKKEHALEAAMAAAEAAREEKLRVSAQLELTAAQLEAMRASGEATANALGHTEAKTRSAMIDVELDRAGWSVDDTNRVGLEIEVLDQPTKSGVGYADYVLWGDDGKPLAVIEAKKTRVDPGNGRTQARYYADGLEKAHGQRPVIFYTNGYDIWIWDDARGYPPRQLHGFYGKQSLERLHFQREQSTKASQANPDLQICDRVAGLETLKRITERFDAGHRAALIVQATGTGKTRVAVSLSDLLRRSNMVKHILFLCDRKELRKQARNAFVQFLPDTKTTIVDRATADDVGDQVFVSTYQTMFNQMEAYDVGFFDLIIADESHRSIYNYYGDLFRYFDALKVGLTATPVNFIDRNTYDLFGCEDGNPTASYTLEEAIADKCLVPFRVQTYQTEFQRDGMRYAKMSAEQKKQLEEQIGVAAESVDYDGDALNRAIFNRDTNRHLMRHLLEKGIRVKDGAELGKTIIFARSHKHAVLLKSIFDELYPNLPQGFCEIVDYQNTRAEALIDEFKGLGTRNDLTIAISVDMLDTGIDVPELVNLVFAKPVRSYVKFWQMLGRGTRTCADLFGPGMHKTEFLIFDHWGNFEHFGEGYQSPPASRVRSIQERVFEARLDLAQAQLDAFDQERFEHTTGLILADLNALVATRSIEVRENRKLLDELRTEELVLDFAPLTRERLGRVASLMRWRSIRGDEAAWRFDEVMTELAALHARNADYADLLARVENAVEGLPSNLSQVKAKSDAIQSVRDTDFWEHVTQSQLEWLRTELRGVMQYGRSVIQPPAVYETDVTERPEGTRDAPFKVKSYGLEQVAYRASVTEALSELVDESETLQKIRRGEPVGDDDLRELGALVLTQNPHVPLERLFELYPETAGRLGSAIRRVLGVDREAVTSTFDGFVRDNPHLRAAQVSFVRLLKRYIIENGGIERETPYDHPFTHLHAAGLEGIFEGDDRASVMQLLDGFFVERRSDPPPAH